MALYERLLKRDDAGNSVSGGIPIHGFQAVMGERARGTLTTNIAARDCLNSFISPPLTPSEETEAITLLNTISGSTTAKLARAKEIDDVLMLGEHAAAGYSTPSAIKTRLGV